MTTVTYICPECEAETVVEYTGAMPGKLDGPPEKCYPPEDASIDPRYCSNCDRFIDMGAVESELPEPDYDDAAEDARNWADDN